MGTSIRQGTEFSLSGNSLSEGLFALIPYHPNTRNGVLCIQRSFTLFTPLKTEPKAKSPVAKRWIIHAILTIFLPSNFTQVGTDTTTSILPHQQKALLISRGKLTNWKESAYDTCLWPNQWQMHTMGYIHCKNQNMSKSQQVIKFLLLLLFLQRHFTNKMSKLIFSAGERIIFLSLFTGLNTCKDRFVEKRRCWMCQSKEHYIAHW